MDLGIRATQRVNGATTSKDNPNCKLSTERLEIPVNYQLTTVNGSDTYAILRYDGAPTSEPTTPQPGDTLLPGLIPFQEFRMKVSHI